MKALPELAKKILECRRCPRLVEWREACAAAPPRRHAGEVYHARPVPGFGDPRAALLVVGLAPAAHGANRTGRMFTGDRSGEWLYRALHKAGFATQPSSVSAEDGLELKRAYITAACRCAPPDNKPTREELAACSGFLDAELDELWEGLRVVVALGAIALDATLTALVRRGVTRPKPAPRFAHGGKVEFGPEWPVLLMSYHPSQQNTFTGRLTETMFDEIWSEARKICEGN